MTRTLVLEPSSTINESGLIKLNSYYPNESIEHHLQDAFEFNQKVNFFLMCGRNIDTSLASIDIALSPYLGVVIKEASSTPLIERDVEHRSKRMAKRKLLNYRERPPIVGWRLNDEKFDELNKAYRFHCIGRML